MMHRDTRGQSLVETAIILPVLLLILAGIVDIGRAFNNYIIITNSAREGVRQGARLPCSPGNGAQRASVRNLMVQAVIREANNSGIALADGNITITPDPVSVGCAGQGNPLRVAVNFNFPTLMGGVLGMANLTLHSQVEMVAYGNDQE